ncbi:histidine phosphatase family protein [Chloroflexota bacterium]
MARLFLVRHGETELKSSERLWGHTDVKLDALGLRQAERLRDRLAAEKIDVIYSSNLQRALVTAETIASRHRLDVIACPELREFYYGKAEGLNYEEIKERYPELHAAMTQKSPSFQFPDGESVDDLAKRVDQFVIRLKKHTPEETVLIVAHFGVLRTLVCRLLGVELGQRWQFHLDLASLSIMETNRQGAEVILLNDVSHLA